MLCKLISCLFKTFTFVIISLSSLYYFSLDFYILFFHNFFLKLSYPFTLMHDFLLTKPVTKSFIINLDIFYYRIFFNYYMVPLGNTDPSLLTKTTFIKYLTFLLQVFLLVIISIWARAAGPRFRLDQLLSITWKDLFLYLSLFLIFLLSLIIFV